MTHLACYAYGVGHADEGVCLRLEIDNYRILLDCGLKNLASLIDNPITTAASASPLTGIAPSTVMSVAAPQIDCVICSHAHTDHAYGLLALHQTFPHIPIYASHITAHLLPLNWPEQTVQNTLCQALPWRSPIEIFDRLTIEFIPAGHLPGAAAILLSYREPHSERVMRVFYSGDFYLSNTRLATGLRLEEIRGLMPDVLILEGSYGTQRHPHRRQQENRLMERIAQALHDQQSILLPVPTIGLGQELLFLLRSHYLFSGRNLDIWVQGLIAMGCDAYLDLISQLPIAVQNFAQTQPLFWDEKVQPRVQRGQPPHQTEPCIVLTDAHTDLSHFCHHGQWLVLFPEATTSTVEWKSHAPTATDPSEAIVTAETYWLSEHSDGNTTLQLIHSLRPQHVLFVHGASDTLADFAHLDELSSRYKIHMPQPGTLVELPVAESAIVDTNLPETRYAGEVAETTTEILISLPIDFTLDPRWKSFADTGVVEAYWQDQQLIIRGMAPTELTSNNAGASQLSRNCLSCQFYRNQRCNNQDSPLFQLQVTPDGYCLEFAATDIAN
ncbi:MBL fold metallo-hydrolase [filamentous cyanobacterium LEGE 11480]|uniref:MBL fold metallo-hydrolase n=1 Tax=Romeriopsis navalis LEGE 11480 TaxID=2777977 RepID=A0A928VHL8_9CYAN|nr:MBL fold metallo-hydrolase [Romeriopsis navalis]MBE9028500.1 MBL fold metallo-hydrolase [Romeriopsis navalis LEGE 11480]